MELGRVVRRETEEAWNQTNLEVENYLSEQTSEKIWDRGRHEEI